MKQEIEKLGFIWSSVRQRYELDGDTDLVVFDDWVCLWINASLHYLFPYNHEKLKQLIKILS